MSNKDFTTTILLSQSPEKVFNAINNVSGWWSQNIQGNTDELNAEFLYHYKDVHSCKIKITELVPYKKVVWHVLENQFSFTKQDNEWKDNDIIFEITEKGKQTQLQFTQKGLTPAYECYDVCHDAWTGFITNSLQDLIVKGKGEPTPKDEDGTFNELLIEKWKINEKSSSGYTYSFESSQPATTIFETLLDVKSWWSGLHDEKIKGNSHKLNDEFTFHAGNGAHYTKQRLIELVPGKKITWLVTESDLNFVKETDEWTNTKISFEISKKGDKNMVKFTHTGLVPRFECYDNCAGAWTQYLEILSEKLK